LPARAHYKLDERPTCEPGAPPAKDPLKGWFTEGFDTRDLKEAKAFFDEA